MTHRIRPITLAALAALLTIAAPASADRRVRVAVELAPAASPIAQVASPLARVGTMTPAAVRAARNPRTSPAGRAMLAARAERRRERALRKLAPHVQATSRVLIGLGRRIERLGGRPLELHGPYGSLVARVPATAVDRIRRWPAVGRVTREPAPKPAALPTGIEAVGIPSFWSAGFSSGSGANDCPANRLVTTPRAECSTGAWGTADGPDLAILSDPVQKDHPTFAGISWQMVGGAPTQTGPYDDHGTPVASVAVGRGVSTCPTAPGFVCDPTYDLNPDFRGSATGLDTVLDVAMKTNEQGTDGYTGTAWMLGIDEIGFSNTNYGHAEDPAEIATLSAVSDVDSDDQPIDRRYDSWADDYGLTMFQGNGNAGTTFGRSACRAYNIVCVGATDDKWTAAVGDDTMASYSSRGPTFGGRKKPDLVAPGNIRAAQRDWKSDGLWRGVEGTSISTPLAAGAGTLLYGSGITDPRAIRAVLINSARQGRATDGSALGTQTGWQPDWGWGMLDMTAALAQRTNFDLTTIAAGDAAFYAASTQAAGDRATLVWNRHVEACHVIKPDCGGPNNQVAQPLSDLNLAEHQPAAASACTGTVRRSSESAIDNVEQVRSPGAASVIYRVAPSSSAAPAETFALAARRQVRRLISPRPQVTATLADPALEVGQTTTLTVTATNPSDELRACHATIAPPTPSAGLTVTDPVGDADGALLEPGETITTTWTVTATAAGAQTITATATGEAYDTTLTGRDIRTLTVTAPPEQVDPVDPIDDAPAPAPAAPAGTPPATTTQVPYIPPALTPTAPDSKQVASALRVTRTAVAKDRRTVKISGTVADGATGTVTVKMRVKLGRRYKTVKRRAYIRDGRFAVKLRLPSRRWRNARVTARYAGNSVYLPRTSRRNVRQRR